MWVHTLSLSSEGLVTARAPYMGLLTSTVVELDGRDFISFYVFAIFSPSAAPCELIEASSFLTSLILGLLDLNSVGDKIQAHLFDELT
ncbi:hypothetical protein Mp_8g17610 [Marchantia polymorpha subsp. ruderalis]|uniref:Uncharacterized protein n=1 Tax=Marchantia polymorpha TaxID=3197 RepID=A0A2R6X8E4_MARPO|nr:hypothetical protein MARPO_0030s0096 [Marchantia polymorpha]BBN20244.1 hypothetical protein Mp_8g17610 [Marchantia polymorpha subsp. ruderalis]|eukprot:PTQ42363.1 hypothetical protein MARPO_0030s0096 [Marchantia polymorpha]